MACLVVVDARSRATSRPVIVTKRAEILSTRGIERIGVFRGREYEVITRPARMLPQASRFRGLMTVGLFSLIGDRGVNRGCPMDTKNTSRRL